MVAEEIPRSQDRRRNEVRQQIGQEIYTAVEMGPMSFISDGGHTAVLLAELAIKRLEAAGWERKQ